MDKVTIQPRTKKQREVISQMDSNVWDYDGFEFIDEENEGTVQPFFLRKNGEDKFPYTRICVYPDGTTKAVKYINVEYSEDGNEIIDMDCEIVSKRNDDNYFELS